MPNCDRKGFNAEPEEMSQGDLDIARLYGVCVAGLTAKLYSFDTELSLQEIS